MSSKKNGEGSTLKLDGNKEKKCDAASRAWMWRKPIIGKELEKQHERKVRIFVPCKKADHFSISFVFCLKHYYKNVTDLLRGRQEREVLLAERKVS